MRIAFNRTINVNKESGILRCNFKFTTAPRFVILNDHLFNRKVTIGTKQPIVIKTSLFLKLFCRIHVINNKMYVTPIKDFHIKISRIEAP